MPWLQLTVAAPRDRADAVSDRLQALGAAAVSLSGSGEEVLLEPPPGGHPLWQQIELRALLPPDADLVAVRERLEAAGGHVADVEFLADDDWQARWRAYAVRACFAGRLWLLPRDEPFDIAVDSGQVVLRLDPGLAFGSGSHPTTRLCLAGLAGLALEGARVLDFGCGSGVLAVAAALLGAREVVAVDHDPQALVATRENAAYNEIDAERLHVMAPEDLAWPAGGEGAFDVVVANILANPLVNLAPALTRCLMADGRLLLSGLLAEQEPLMRQAYPDVAFDPPVAEDGWIRLDGRLRASA